MRRGISPLETALRGKDAGCADVAAPIAVLLVADREAVRAVVRSVLSIEDGVFVVGVSTSGREALLRARETSPDVVLMDVSMQDTDCILATRLLRVEFPNIKVVALTAHEDKFLLDRMLKAGASGLLARDCSPEELVRAIRSVFRGDTYLSPDMTRLLVSEYLEMARTASLSHVFLPALAMQESLPVHP